MEKMKITYQNEWAYTDIHVDLPILYEEDYQMKMINFNHISGLLPVYGGGRDGESRYTFRLENGMSMDKIYSETEMQGREIEKFMEQLSDLIEQMKAFLLNQNNIVLDPKLIFKKEEKYYFCYLPVVKKENRDTLCKSFHELTEYFVKHLDYKDTKGVFLVSKMHRETLKENYDLKQLIKECKKEIRQQNTRRKKSERSGEQKRGDEMPEEISEKVIFSPEEQVKEKKQLELCKEEQNYMKRNRVKKVMNKMKGERWGKWDDLITEIDGQGTSSIL